MRFIAIALLSLILLTGCGRKLDPTLDDYLPPDEIQSISLSSDTEKIIISWNHPEKAKGKVESFLIERVNKGEKKELGYYGKDINSLEDRDFIFGETYTYRIFAISAKGVYSKPIEASITPKKLPDVVNLEYKITPEGVLLSWEKNQSLSYNIYRLDRQGQRKKIGFSEKNLFLDEILPSNIIELLESSKSYITYQITPALRDESAYIEGKAKEINVSIDQFIPSKPEEIFWTINEYGAYISWKEVPEKWIIGYKIYRKYSKEANFQLIGTTKIPLFFDDDYNINNIQKPVYYRISTQGPLRDSEAFEIKVEAMNE